MPKLKTIKLLGKLTIKICETLVDENSDITLMKHKSYIKVWKYCIYVWYNFKIEIIFNS